MLAPLRGNAAASKDPNFLDLRSKHDIYVSGPSFSLLANLQASRMLSQSIVEIKANHFFPHAAGLKRSRGSIYSSLVKSLSSSAHRHKVKVQQN